jgi:CarD family transcriptional regulator
MFKEGTAIVHPLQGAGIIEAIEEHNVLNESHKYYVIRLSTGSMKIMVPVELSEKIGLREITEKEEFGKVIAILKGEGEKTVVNWKSPYSENLLKMKEGSIYKVAEVACNLSLRSKEKTLSIEEKRLFENACNAIATEMAYVYQMKIAEADSMVRKTLKDGRAQMEVSK